MNILEFFYDADAENLSPQNPSAACDSCSDCAGCASVHGHDIPVLIEKLKKALSEKELLDGIEFHIHTTASGEIDKYSKVKKLLGMADLSPAVLINGRLVSMGGFNPEKLAEAIEETLKKQ
jgi:hypothetical protein